MAPLARRPILAAPGLGWLSGRIGRLPAKLGVMVGLIVAATALALGPTWLVVVGVLALGGLWASYPSLTATYVRDQLDDRAFGSAYGTMTVVYGAAAVVAPAAVGILADRFDGFTVPYLVLAALAVVGSVVLLTVPGGLDVASPGRVDHDTPASPRRGSPAAT